MEQLLDPLYVGLHILNLIAMVIILRLLVYKPMKKFMAKRREAVAEETRAADEALAAAENTNLLIQQEKKDLEQKTRNDCYNILTQAHSKAEEIIAAAHQDAEQITAEARKQAQETVDAAAEQQRQAAAVLAVDIASAVLPKKLTAQEQQDLLDASLEEAKRHEL